MLQNEFEANYLGYLRRPIYDIQALDAPFYFAECAGGMCTAHYFAIGMRQEGVGHIILRGTINPSLPIEPLVIPRISIDLSLDWRRSLFPDSGNIQSIPKSRFAVNFRDYMAKLNQQLEGEL